MKLHAHFVRRLIAAGLVTCVATLLSACGGSSNSSNSMASERHAQVRADAPPVAAATMRVHFHRPQNDESVWGVYSWEGPVVPSPAWITGRFMFTGADSFGGYVDIPLDLSKSIFRFLVTDGQGTKNCSSDQSTNFAPTVATSGQEIWLMSGECTIYNQNPAATTPVAPGVVRMHFYRSENDASSWGVYSWQGPVTPSPAWITGRFMFNHIDLFGGYTDIAVDTSQHVMKFLITDGSGNKNCGNDQTLLFAPNIAKAGQEAWLLEGDCKVYGKPPSVNVAKLDTATALWLTADTIAWPNAPTGSTYRLFYAYNGGMGSNSNGITGADGSIALTVDPAGLSANLQSRFPYIKTATALKLASADAAHADLRLKGQVIVAQFGPNGQLIQGTSLQTADVLDNIYFAAAQSGQLGLSFNSQHVPSFALWAPTAHSVSLNIYADANTSNKTTVAMSEDPATGIWHYTAPDASWTKSAYYTYSVNVFSRWANNGVVTNEVSDPYSLSLNANGVKSFVVDLSNAALKPSGWDTQQIPPLAAPTDISIYELHVRDFSVNDNTVPLPHRGKFMAFTDVNANGMQHLRRLQNAGLTHIHLLPVFDISSVNETGCTVANVPNAAPDSDQQQAAVAANQGNDCFNWGYDPYHYNAPEGSYSTNANDGAVRVLEFRSMVKALHDNGLRLVMDVVYNHTSDAKQNPHSVLDKIVPGYYYRMNATGDITGDSCCSDTAAEHAMMGKLMVDSVKTWATQYQVDGFRFDIMGMAPLSVIQQIKTDVSAAAGRDIYLYGEAWNFGAVANDARFVQARQANLPGTGIGSFNDRLRDTVRGGGCCDSGAALISQQGLINGVYYDPNASSTQTLDDLLRLSDLARVGLSGTLRDYSFVNRYGNLTTNANIDYFGQPAGYTGSPSETINYIEAHDNQTLFDLNAYKLPVGTSMAERVRAQQLGNAINMLSQGVPFFHAGQDLLRSKSMDRNSYASGDWFNALDFSFQSNNFGVGLPISSQNHNDWPLIQPLLANPALKPGSTDILSARNGFTDLLALRKDTTLFRLRTAQDVIDRLSFFNTGPNQVPGMIVMNINGVGYSGAKYKSVTVVFNVDKVGKSVTVDALKNRNFTLHPIQANGSDSVVKSATYNANNGGFAIPARTAAVFIEN